jgi:hypothetical protein
VDAQKAPISNDIKKFSFKNELPPWSGGQSDMLTIAFGNARRLLVELTGNECLAAKSVVKDDVDPQMITFPLKQTNKNARSAALPATLFG